MALAPGTSLGPYVIVGPLGSGGMGEVYRGRDDRLGRDVALKVLRPDGAADPERLRRFEQEARAAGALNHPQLLTVFDTGVHEGAPFLVFELLEGETLRERLAHGPLAARRAVEIAAGIAEGLAAAHEKAIVHRDLKPENIFLTRDGRPKVLDFGLAKLRADLDHAVASNLATLSGLTTPGTVLGTLSYMSPEQLQGRTVDPRTDIFSLGLVLYEMLVGRRPFQRETLEASVAATLTQDPPPIGLDSFAGDAALRSIAARCLEKRPEGRFQSAQDLAFALRALVSSSETVSSPAQEAALSTTGAPSRRTFLALAAGMAVTAGAFWLGRSTAPTPQASYHRLTFHRGDVRGAAFAPDGQSVVYSAAWGGGTYRVFSTRPDSPESRLLDLPDAHLFAVSKTGEMAVCLGQTSHVAPGEFDCTLARVALAGGAPRPVLEHVSGADFSPDGRELAVVRRTEGRDRLEYPVGRVLVEGDSLSQVRVSPSGEWLAFMANSTSAGRGLEVVRRDGTGHTVLSGGYVRGFGVAWSPDGREVWYTASESGSTQLSLYGVDLRGRRRLILALPALANVIDVASDGSALFSIGDLRAEVVAWASGDPRERLLSWLEFPTGLILSGDGRTVFISESGQGAGPVGAAVYARALDGSPAVRLGEGYGLDVSADGRLVVALARSRAQPSPELVAIPTGAGETRSITKGEIEYKDARWFRAGDRLLAVGRQAGRPWRLWIVAEDVAPRPVTPEGFDLGVPSPDGRSWVGQRIRDRALLLFASEGDEGRLLAGPLETGRLATWALDGRSLLVIEPLLPGARVVRRDLATGSRTPVRDLTLQDPTSVARFRGTVAPSGDAFAAFYIRAPTALFLVRGLR
jgi:serine/threonine protein kinase/dipeptidyl aminopeptidase/acylaminoacyl peptidase